MRRALAFGLILLAACGCHRGSSGGVNDPEALIQDLDSAKDQQSIQDAAKKLYASGPTAIEPIGEALTQRELHNQPYFVQAVSAIPDERVLPVLVRAFYCSDPQARGQACYGMAFFPRADSQYAVFLHKRKVVTDREWSTYLFARRPFGNAKAFLLESIKDPVDSVRAEAARGMRHYPGAATVKLLEPLIDEKDDLLSRESLISLSRIDPTD